MTCSLILSNTNSIENAKLIANTLVKDKLAACVNIIPQIKSIYFWNNEITEDDEYLMVIKTKKDIKEYSKEEYLKYSNPNFLQDTKGYKILEQEFNSRMFYGEDLFKKMIDVLMPYTVEVRLGEKSADEMLEMLLEQIRQMNAIGLGNVDVENVQKGFKKLNSELVKWK